METTNEADGRRDGLIFPQQRGFRARQMANKSAARDERGRRDLVAPSRNLEKTPKKRDSPTSDNKLIILRRSPEV